MPHESSIGETRVLLSGLGMGESPRWHDARLWFSDWGTNEVVAVDLEGNAEVMAEGGGGSGWAANWLPDGRMLITGAELMRLEPDGSRVRHAELSSVSPYGWSETTIDGRGNIYVNTINFDFADFNDVIGSGKAPGKIALVTPDGEAREVADGLAFPNGMVVTPDNATRSSSPSRSLVGSRPSTSQPMGPCRTGGCGRTSPATGSAWTPKARCGAATSAQMKEVSVSGSARVGRCSIGSSSTAPATPACWEVRMAGRCSWSWRGGSVRTGSTSCSGRGRVRSWPPGWPCRTRAGREPFTRRRPGPLSVAG